MTTPVLKPPQLTLGDTLGLVAPSLPLLPSSKKAYDAGKARLQALGFKLKEGRTITLRRWWSAGTPEEQAEDINAMFADASVRAVVAASGGFSAMSVLDLLDYDLIRRYPKPFVGFSDITLYQLAMFTKTGLVGFHGNTVSGGFGEFFPPPSFPAEYLSSLY